MARHGEEGAVAITTAIVLIVLILLASFLVDLGSSRADARADQLLADSSVMAGALTEGSAEAQCEAAIDLYAVNLSSTATPLPAAACADVFPEMTWACTDATDDPDPATWTAPTSAVYEIGDFTMEVTIPVPDDDPAMVVGGQVINPNIDANPCARIKITVQRTRDYVFGGAAGVASSGGSRNDAVAVRYTPAEPDTFASLIVLERDDCPGLSGNGGTKISVDDGPDWDHDGDPGTPDVPSPGIITLDTFATGSDCSPNQNSGSNADKAVKAGATGCISATGHIYSLAVLRNNAARAYSTAQLVPCGSGSLAPRPEPGAAVGRRQIDHRFNCLTSYPASTTPDGQRYPRADHATADRHGSCGDVAARPPFIDQLHGALDSGDISLSHSFTPVGGAGNCPAINVDGVAAGTPRLWIRCNVGGNQFQLTNVDYVVFDQPISFSNAVPVITGRPGHGAVVYFRNGGIIRAGDLSFTDTFVYIDNGYVDLGDNDDVMWKGLPFTTGAEVRARMHTQCVPYATAHENGLPLPSDLPYPSCFAPLALWSNGSTEHQLGGGGALTVEGTFFTPNATTKIFGNDGQVLDGAQFFSNVLEANGGKTFSLTPDPLTGVPVPPPAPGLIR